ncbi:LPS-assembly protein LptD [Rubrivivax albus]|uniref:LPS-assembly protein LptD n=1 Tax=Rubrivivax albus TaxID=2499835 RepID=UPI0013054163|nr:LPS assembly protein LptD [Rubrivivax albus]
MTASVIGLPTARAAEPALTRPAAALPIELSAERLTVTTDRETVAEGDVRLRQGGLLIRADRLSYRPPTDRAAASGGVRLEREGAIFRGDAAELTVRDFSGWFVAPQFDFPPLGTRGEASRIDFASRTQLTAADARYTSCPRPEDGSEPDWQLQARSVTMDFDANEGRAEGARLRFQGVSILALPRLSFPVTGARKTGWLPPTVGLDSRSGLELAVPWYWNLAPDRDLTLTPRVLTRRGVGLDTQLRWLAPEHQGQVDTQWLPDDRVAGRARGLLALRHQHALGALGTLRVDGVRVSDDDWWKDFPRFGRLLTPRLLDASARLDRPMTLGPLALNAYAQVQHWQVLQDAEAPIVAPYARAPRLGLSGRGRGGWLGPLEVSGELELNRFERPDDDSGGLRPEAWRWHALGQVAWPWRAGGVSLVPRLALNAARYRTDEPMADGRREAGRLIGTFSFDAGLRLERDAEGWFGRTSLRQTLEPRLLYVRTPYKRQDHLPNFDAYGKDFNLSSIYTTNAFSGIDRVSDANELTAGVTSRLIDPGDGAELLRVGIVQRFRFADQRVAPQADGDVDGPVQDQRLSDILLFGSTTLLPRWTLDASMQYSPDIGRLQRSILGASYLAGPYRTVSGRYRLARGVSEQFELGWQWPLNAPAAGGRPRSSCSGTWYGVGRINYSLKDSRITDSLVGAEYDAGCWILRMVAERQSTGVSAATTRLMLQLELVGLSRLGPSPLQVLKDNIPGYRLLREADDAPAGAAPTP